MNWFKLADSKMKKLQTFEARERINNKLNSHMTASPGMEPGATVVRGEHSHRYATHASRI
jgi:hypothetical protein